MSYTKKQKELFNRFIKQINKNVVNNSKENNKDKSKLIDEETENKNLLDENDSSRHIVNVIA